MIPLKQWVYQEAERLGKAPNSIYLRIYAGAYPGMMFKRSNARVVQVPDKRFDYVPGRNGHRLLLPHGAEVLKEL